MALTFDYTNKVIESSASLLDLVAFHAELRDAEDSPLGMVHPVTHTWKALDLGGGAFFYGLELINGWVLKFPTPGNYLIAGNLGGTIVPVAGVYVERKTSAAYATTAVGGSGPSASSIAAAVRADLSAELLRIVELASIHGLVQGAPLTVSPAARAAGDVAQTITQSGEVVTVTRA